MADLTQAQANTLNMAFPAANLIDTGFGDRIRNLELFATAVRGYECVPLPVEDFLRISGNDVMTGATAIGGRLAINTAGARLKRINAATNPVWEMQIPSATATATFEVQKGYGFPSDLDADAAMYVRVRARKQTGAATQILIVTTRFGEASAKSSTTAVLTSAFSWVTHTITAATVPAGAYRGSLVLTHGKSNENDKITRISHVEVYFARTRT